jgi:ubiquinone/menaquinone biosynthesis C-methylase UbiE
VSRRPSTSDPIKRFDDWSSTYEKSATWKFFFDPIHQTVVREAGEVRGLSVLDVGCGTGDMLRRFAAAGASRLVGVDSSGGMLEVARRLSGSPGDVTYIEGSAESLELEAGAFDLVTSCIAFHHFAHPEGALSEIARVLSPGGRLLVCDMCSEGAAGRIMLAYGRMRAADDHYFDRETLAGMMTAAGLETTGARRVRLFPPAMLVTALKPVVGPTGVTGGAGAGGGGR